LNDYDTLILESVWSAFLRVAADFPADPAVMITLQYHDWYTSECWKLPQTLK